MKAQHRPRFDIDVLRELGVLAQVAGTEDYRTELTGHGEDIDGECSCRAFEDWGFCKHMVATALAANDVAGSELDSSGVLDRIRGHLKEKGIDALVEMVMEFVERDPALFRKLDAAAATLHEDDKTLGARLRKMIDSATRMGDFLDYRETADWAAQVDSALDSIAGLASELAPASPSGLPSM